MLKKAWIEKFGLIRINYSLIESTRTVLAKIGGIQKIWHLHYARMINTE
jgi:hypothetical protein